MPVEASVLRRIGGLAVGLVASVPLHVLGLAAGIFAGMLLGLGSDGPWPQRTQSLFVISFGLWQWLYLIPLALWVRKRHAWVAAGLAGSGCFGLLVAGAGALALLFAS